MREQARHRARLPHRRGPVALATRLVHLNGPPGIGKSTIAAAYARARPGTLVLDVDVIRAERPDWRASPIEAGLWARDVALARARGQLLVGCDVVVAQYVARPAFLEGLTATAAETAAAFHELCLIDTRDCALARFVVRGTDPSMAAHHQDCVEQAGGLEGIAVMYDELVAFLATRPDVVRIPTEAGEERGALAAVLTATA